MKRPRPQKSQPKLPWFDRNLYIKAAEMRVITDEGENLGVLDKNTALAKAQELGQDLILINPTAEPPIARIIAWSKFKYEQSKKKRASQNKGAELKEIWFGPSIDEGDLSHKVERIQEFLAKNHKVRIIVGTKRRPKSRRFDPMSKKHETMGIILSKLADKAEPETPPKQEGNNVSVYVKLKK